MHFSTDVSLNTEINIVCRKSDEVDVHVGFLQESHIYEIQFAIPNRFPNGWKPPELIDSDLQILSIDSVGKLEFSLFAILQQWLAIQSIILSAEH